MEDYTARLTYKEKDEFLKLVAGSVNVYNYNSPKKNEIFLDNGDNLSFGDVPARKYIFLTTENPLVYNDEVILLATDNNAREREFMNHLSREEDAMKLIGEYMGFQLSKAKICNKDQTSVSIKAKLHYFINEDNEDYELRGANPGPYVEDDIYRFYLSEVNPHSDLIEVRSMYSSMKDDLMLVAGGGNSTNGVVNPVYEFSIASEDDPKQEDNTWQLTKISDLTDEERADLVSKVKEREELKNPAFDYLDSSYEMRMEGVAARQGIYSFNFAYVGKYGHDTFSFPLKTLGWTDEESKKIVNYLNGAKATPISNPLKNRDSMESISADFIDGLLDIYYDAEPSMETTSFTLSGPAIRIPEPTFDDKIGTAVFSRIDVIKIVKSEFYFLDDKSMISKSDDRLEIKNGEIEATRVEGSWDAVGYLIDKVNQLELPASVLTWSVIEKVAEQIKDRPFDNYLKFLK